MFKKISFQQVKRNPRQIKKQIAGLKQKIAEQLLAKMLCRNYFYQEGYQVQQLLYNTSVQKKM